MRKFNVGDKVKIPTKKGRKGDWFHESIDSCIIIHEAKELNQDYLYVNFYVNDKNNLIDEEKDDIISLVATEKNIGTISGNYYLEEDLELYEEETYPTQEGLYETKELDVFTSTPPNILSESCEITFTQDNDCMDDSNSGQFLKIKTENGGVDGDKDDFFILETERWAFDNIDEMILLLQTFKSRYEKWKN